MCSITFSISVILFA
uniref:Uncharacterized protein n=1 Tax=Rhizophora mucronata TaxID=61149 RepID=A0A2P2J4P1_RHIMU